MASLRLRWIGSIFYFDRSKNRGLRGRCPLDQHLGLFGSFTPGFARIASRAAAQSSYGGASADLKELAGPGIGSRQFQRLCQDAGAALREKLKRLPAPPEVPVPIMYVEADGTGVPMSRQSLQGVKGRGADGQAKTREVKTGCVFTQTSLNKEGEPERDEDSTTWIAGIETASEFGPKLRDEAKRRGIAKAAKVVLLGDGAAGIFIGSATVEAGCKKVMGAGKVRPCLLLTGYPGNDELALVTIIPHTTALRGNRCEVNIDKPYLKGGAFHLQQIQSVPTVRLMRKLGVRRSGRWWDDRESADASSH